MSQTPPHQSVLESNPRIGEILLNITTLDPKDLQKALEDAEKTRGFVGEILIRNALIQPKDLMRALALLKNRPRIGEILIRFTTLSESQLDKALEIQKEEGGLIGDILLKHQMIQPHEMLRALCFQIGIPFLEEIREDEIPPELVQDLPINYAKSKEILPIKKIETSKGEEIIAVCSDPFQQGVKDDLQVLLGLPIQICVSTSSRILDAINRVYERNSQNLVGDLEGDFEEENYDLDQSIDILEATENDAPVIKFVNSIIFRAVKEHASDIHIEVYEREFVVRFRVDGVMYDVVRQPKKAHAAVASRIKIMGNLDIAEKRLPQDGRIKIKIAGKDIDMRLSTVPTTFGERIVLRILEASGKLLQLQELGFSQNNISQIEKLISRKYGIILVTGPTGHGKSTTLSSCLSKLNSPDRNILTVEDPIEYQIKGINQVQVNAKIELTFARALRSFLRQNPDVIMVGEIRDRETGEIAIQASLTGHLVMSTLHTNDSASAPTRLIDMGIEPFLVASSMLGIVAQRLIRRVCTHCRVPHELTEFEKQELGISSLPKGATLFKEKGCAHCNFTGFSGRIVIGEVLMIDDEIRTMVGRNLDAGQIKKRAIEKGMKTIRDDGIDKIFSGITTVSEVMRVTQAEE